MLAACGGYSATPQASPTHSPAPVPIQTPTSISDKCLVAVKGPLATFRAPDGSSMPAATLGKGTDAVVFLHQTAPSGFCGFAPYAAWAAQRGVRAILFDLCGWGRATCTQSFASNLEAQVRLPVQWAREHGARRVTVVGASMGGSLALGLGQKVGADAVVDLSGPADWQGVPSAGVAARSVTVPLLVAASDKDAGLDVAALRAAVKVSPARTKRYVATPEGHGWEMLSASAAPDPPKFTPLATTVLQWVKGSYSG